MTYEGEFQLRSCNFNEGKAVLTNRTIKIVDNMLDFDRDRVDLHWPELLERGVEFGMRFKVTIELLE